MCREVVVAGLGNTQELLVVGAERIKKTQWISNLFVTESFEIGAHEVYDAGQAAASFGDLPLSRGGGHGGASAQLLVSLLEQLELLLVPLLEHLQGVFHRQWLQVVRFGVAYRRCRGRDPCGNNEFPHLHGVAVEEMHQLVPLARVFVPDVVEHKQVSLVDQALVERPPEALRLLPRRQLRAKLRHHQPEDPLGVEILGHIHPQGVVEAVVFGGRVHGPRERRLADAGHADDGDNPRSAVLQEP
uniref:Uncharacterized protein n=1 Tax=Arundo donax TaxID=35708 RepID=A0A0A8Y3R1_ARUDO